jgi:hypothetical protein
LINLRGPTGDPIVLDGRWVEVDAEAEPMTWWIRTQGDCVWGSGQVEDVQPGQVPVPWLVQSLNGVIGSDFVITGEILLLGPMTFSPQPPYSPLRMLIEVDDAGEVLLREDRDPGVPGPRCPDPNFCPDPVVLQRAD